MISTPVQKNNNTDSQKSVRKIKKEYRFLIIVIAALTVALILSVFVFRLARVNGDSMDGTYSHSDWLIVSPIPYLNNSPQRGDIVILKRDSITEGHIVKRIVALPGETVEIRNGIVYINDEPLDDPFFVYDEDDNFSRITVEDNSYFVLGDNRAFSNDSRHWNDPFVRKDEIRGKVVLKIIPEISKPTHSIF